MGEARGMMNFGIPSIQLKMMAPKFDQQWALRQRSGSPTDQNQMLRLVQRIPVGLDVRLEGATLQVKDLLHLRPGDVVSLDIPERRPAEMQVNGCRKFLGRLVAAGNTRGFAIEEAAPEHR